MTEETLRKLVDFEEKVSFLKGPFQLFALMKMKGDENVWTINVAAEWMEREGFQQAAAFLAGQFKVFFEDEEDRPIVGFSHLPIKHLLVKTFQQMFSVQHQAMEFKDCDFNGFKPKHLFLITASKNSFNPQHN